MRLHNEQIEEQLAALSCFVKQYSAALTHFAIVRVVVLALLLNSWVPKPKRERVLQAGG